ncbi:MFS transporter [Paenibacillus rhizophilus]|uniref:MFS transporter n=1 Tax=Paenibacillus rhizophilus TaxID=1850366 RepID=A0A3N9PCK8_9BACL|nr:aromatic acid/H+ symport family MFS transporter [Paenibacillus rhizophilus]RQW13345.1 MFS transporter [Paenibacillus rhizophilus]
MDNNTGTVHESQTSYQSSVTVKTSAVKRTKSITGLVIGLCWFCIFFEGYDLGIYGPVLPILMKKWSLTAIEAGAIASYSLFGLLAGSIVVGAITDIIGRKKTLIFSLALFSIAMGISASATTPEMFAFSRVIVGLGIGGIIPSVATLSIEYSPVHRRSFNFVVTNTGITFGVIAAVLTALFFLDNLGWRILFWIGIAPVLVIPFIIKFLPESISFLLAKDRREEAAAIANRFNLSLDTFEESKRKNTSQEAEKLQAFKSLLSKKYIGIIIIASMIYFLTFVMAYGLNTWLPKLMQQAGYPLTSSLVFMLVFNLTGVAGSLIGGKIADRIGSKWVLGVAYSLTAISIFLLSFKIESMFILYSLIGIAGIGVVATTGITIGLVSSYFSSENRATATGFTIGIGRIGAATGPVLGGLLLTRNVPLAWSFYTFAIVAVLAVLAVVLIPKKSE